MSKDQMATPNETIKKETVVLVGSGINSLMTAWKLREKFHLTVVEKNGNFTEEVDQYKTDSLSVKSDGRHANPEETLPFNKVKKKRYPLDDVSEGGWLCKEKALLTSSEKAWQEAFYNIAVENQPFYEEATQLAITLNKEGMKKWLKLFEKHLELTEGIDKKDTLYRIFVCPPSIPSENWYAVEEEVNLWKKNNDTFRFLPQEEITALFPGVKHIKQVVEVEGFSVNITRLVQNMINFLKKEGVAFMWDSRVERIHKDKEGKVSGIDVISKNGLEMRLKPNHFVISTGNGGNDLLEGCDSHGKVQGLAGLWCFKLPNLHGMKKSFKVMADERAGVSNITVSADGKWLYVSGMHGFVGSDKTIHWEKGQAAALKERFCQYIKEIFPEEYKAATQEGRIPLEIATGCIRPSTADGLPIIEETQTKKGKGVINVGGNCGGFVEAPVMAKGIAAILTGRDHRSKGYCEDLKPTRTSINPAGYGRGGM